MKHLVFIVLIMSGLACSNDTVAQKKLQTAEFETMLNKTAGVQLIDVRTPEEFAAGHLVGAKNINYYDADFQSKINQVDKSKPVLVYCAVGGRSAQAASKMNKMGFTQVYDLAGGINAWNAAGKKTVQ
ncbi:MAG: rhodanese-like domain-containing protein [Lewinellaceae bacterium]|nr:rhodanese-like domain-containing protein [Lewinellaceae bacterium]